MIPVGTTRVSVLDTKIYPIIFSYKLLCRGLNTCILVFVHDGPNFHLNITFQLYKCFEAMNMFHLDFFWCIIFFY